MDEGRFSDGKGGLEGHRSLSLIFCRGRHRPAPQPPAAFRGISVPSQPGDRMLKELETHLLLSERVGLLARENAQAVLVNCDGLGRMMRALIRSLQEKTSK